MDRFVYQNLLAASGSVILPSAEQSGFPASRLRDPMPSLEWRTPVGYTFGPYNDRLDFQRDATSYTAVLTHGTYATPATAAAHVAARMNAEDGNSYVVDEISPFRFRISGASDFELLISSGLSAVFGISAWPDLGWSGSDEVGGNSYVASTDVYQSRSWLTIDLLAAAAFDVAIVHEHNLTAGGVVTLEANNTNTWDAVGFSGVIGAAGDKRISFPLVFNSYRYLRITIDDRLNTDGFTRIGVPFVGEYLQPSRKHHLAERHERTGGSRGIRAEGGALYQERKQQGGVWSILFEGLTDADKLALEAMADEVRSGGSFFWARNAPSDLSDTMYVAYQDFALARMPGTSNKWVLGLDLEEALG